MDLIAPMVVAGIVLHRFHTEGRKEVWTSDAVDTTEICIITSVEVTKSMIIRQIDHLHHLHELWKKLMDTHS